MDTKQIEYILMIAEENNITKAAERLFITQSALNQQLLKLERELGTPLFERSRTNWHPTEAGEVYLKNAREILRLKKETYNQISDIAATRRGNLTIGFTPGRGSQMFTSIYPRFHQAYPQIHVNPLEKGVRELQSLIADNTVDVAFLTLRESDQTNDCYIPLLDEEILLAVPQGHPLCETAPPPGETMATLDLTAVQYEPFVIMNRESTMRRFCNDLFAAAGFTPNILFETRSNDTILSMIRTKLCCGLIPSHYARRANDGIVFFRLPSRPFWQVTACYKRDAYLSQAARYFISLVKDIWIQEA
ncbi:MAG: LysR family transcriptional regulator [Eubacteriales bacterium]|nr:LysR family transcriptional regulator [Eubacteriales bacterium]